MVKAEHADLGIALDGDGDRLIMVDNKGEVVDGDEIIFILADYFKPIGVVGTQMSNFGMEMALRQRNIDFVRTKVGDRYVIEEMEKRQWILGGESSGHIICRKFSATGDGIVAALQVLAVILAKGQTLHQLKSAMHKLPQHMINIKVNKIPNLNSSSKLQAAINTVEKKLIGKGRVLLRSSGTESVVRVMVEGEDKLLIEKLAQQLAEQVTTLIC